MSQAIPITLKEVEIKNATGPLANLAYSRVNVTVQCGEPARIELSLAGPGQKNSNVDIITSGAQLSNMISRNTKFQEDMFLGNMVPYKITLQENTLTGPLATNTSATFKGYIASPGFSIAPGQFASTVSLVHEDVVMESLDPSVYLRHPSRMGTSESAIEMQLALNYKTTGGFLSSVKLQNLNKHIQLLLDVSVNGNWNWKFDDNARKDTTNEKADIERSNEVSASIHAHNQNIYNNIEVIKNFLERSTDTELQSNSGDLTAAVKVFQNSNKGRDLANDAAYADWICTQYASSRNFYNFIMGVICPSFLLEYTCQIDGESKIGHPQTDSKEETEVSVEMTSFSFNLGSRYQRALGMVVCNGVGRHKVGAYEKSNTDVDIGAFPKAGPEPGDGKIMHSETPPWFHPNATIHPRDKQRSELHNEPIPADGRNPEAKGEDDFQTTKETVDVNQGNSSYEFLQLWAEKQYRLWALKNATATIQIPLNFDWGLSTKYPIGKRYKINAKALGREEDITLFSGYLNRVNHNAAVGSNKGTAITTLDFTHIKSGEGPNLAQLN